MKYQQVSYCQEIAISVTMTDSFATSIDLPQGQPPDAIGLRSVIHQQV